MKKVCGLEKISREKGGDYPRGQSIKDKGVAAGKKNNGSCRTGTPKI